MGWFISGRTAAGFSININPSGEKTTFEENGSSFQSDKFNGLNLGIGAFARSYILNSKAILPFTQLGINAGISRLETEGYFYGGSPPAVFKRTYSGKSSGGFFTDAKIMAGATKMVGKFTGLDLYLGYNYSYARQTMNTTTLRDDQLDGVIDETGRNEAKTSSSTHRFLIGVAFQVFLEKRRTR
jgi:hypothetical protein